MHWNAARECMILCLCELFCLCVICHLFPSHSRSLISVHIHIQDLYKHFLQFVFFFSCCSVWAHKLMGSILILWHPFVFLYLSVSFLSISRFIGIDKCSFACVTKKSCEAITQSHTCIVPTESRYMPWMGWWSPSKCHISTWISHYYLASHSGVQLTHNHFQNIENVKVEKRNPRPAI